MGETITISDTYCAGVSEFLKYAQRNTDDEVLPFLCVKCKNGSNESPDLIKLHLIKWGIRKDYTLWDFHGETNEFPYVPERMQLDEELKPHPILNDLIDDAFEVHGMPPNISNDFVDGYTSNIQYEFLNEDKDYIRLKCEATRPLYPNCKPDHTSLYAMIGLHNIKSRYGLSGKAVSEVLRWVKDLLPIEEI